jgi:hypothetical protein
VGASSPFRLFLTLVAGLDRITPDDPMDAPELKAISGSLSPDFRGFALYQPLPIVGRAALASQTLNVAANDTCPLVA